MILILNYKTYFKTIDQYLENINLFKNVWHAINPYFYLKLRELFPDAKLGLQNLSFVFDKPLTGEIYPDFEKIEKADFVLLGHSERFKVGENQNFIIEKIKTLQDYNFKLVIFFSELNYQPKKYFKEVKQETEKVFLNYLRAIKEKNKEKIIFVYEPWWAISTELGQSPSKEFLEEFLLWFKNNWQFLILYGGSFDSELGKIYKDLPFDGFVIGKASTRPEEIKKILEIY